MAESPLAHRLQVFEQEIKDLYKLALDASESDLKDLKRRLVEAVFLANACEYGDNSSVSFLCTLKQSDFDALGFGGTCADRLRQLLEEADGKLKNSPSRQKAHEHGAVLAANAEMHASYLWNAVEDIRREGRLPTLPEEPALDFDEAEQNYFETKKLLLGRVLESAKFVPAEAENKEELLSRWRAATVGSKEGWQDPHLVHWTNTWNLESIQKLGALVPWGVAQAINLMVPHPLANAVSRGLDTRIKNGPLLVRLAGGYMPMLKRCKAEDAYFSPTALAIDESIVCRTDLMVALGNATADRTMFCLPGHNAEAIDLIGHIYNGIVYCPDRDQIEYMLKLCIPAEYILNLDEELKKNDPDTSLFFYKIRILTKAFAKLC